MTEARERFGDEDAGYAAAVSRPEMENPLAAT
jgi:hypothetical protein